MIAHVKRAKNQTRSTPSVISEDEIRFADRQFGFAGREGLKRFLLGPIAINFRLLRDSRRIANSPRNARRRAPSPPAPDGPRFINILAIAVFGEVALGARQSFDKLLFQRIAKEFFGELHSAAGELNHLHGFDA